MAILKNLVRTKKSLFLTTIKPLEQGLKSLAALMSVALSFSIGFSCQVCLHLEGALSWI